VPAEWKWTPSRVDLGNYLSFVSFLQDRIVRPHFSIKAPPVVRCNGSTSFRALLVCPQFPVRLAQKDVIDAARLELGLGSEPCIGSPWRVPKFSKAFLESGREA
jgi:hypothetical protein